MPSCRRLRTSALVVCLAAMASVSYRPARAQAPNDANSSDGANVTAARRHYERAREDYGHGAYREAIGELEAAHALDPTAKDLVFNLGVVHEKLSDIDDALGWFQMYTTMSVTPAERERADAYIRRLEGAKKELAQRPPNVTSPSSGSPTPQTETPTASRATTADQSSERPPDGQGRGRIDVATIGATAGAGAALVFGGIMGVKAMDDRPPSGFVTGRDGSYAALANRVDMAHREAVVADIAFGVSVAAGITAAVLYFGRVRGSPGPSTAAATVSAAPLTGGGALVVQGCL